MNIFRRRKQKVAAVMIVKNEEERLPRCLKSLKEQKIKAIISDTGSTDDSIKIAKSFGAHVVPGQWRNDFSEARNQAFVLADELGVDWALIIDADEWQEFDKSLHDLANRPDAVSLYYFPMRNQLTWRKADGEWAFGWTWQPRFVRMAAIPFYGSAIHNKMGCVRTKVFDRMVDYVIKHDGYAKSQPEMNMKLAKRLPQIDGIMAKEGATATLLFDKVRALARANQNEEAQKVMAQADAAFAQHGEYTIPLANMQGSLASIRGDFETTIRMLYRAHELNPNYMDAEFNLAHIWMMYDKPNFKRAARYLRSHKKRCDAFWAAPEKWECNEELTTVDANEIGWVILEHKKKEAGGKNGK